MQAWSALCQSDAAVLVVLAPQQLRFGKEVNGLRVLLLLPRSAKAAESQPE